MAVANKALLDISPISAREAHSDFEESWAGEGLKSKEHVKRKNINILKSEIQSLRRARYGSLP